MNHLVWKLTHNCEEKKHKKGHNKPQLSERILKLTKVMLAKSIQDCFHCRSLFHSGTVLAGRFRQVYDNK